MRRGIFFAVGGSLAIVLLTAGSYWSSSAAGAEEKKNTVDSTTITSMAGHRGICAQCHRSDTSAQYAIDFTRSRIQFSANSGGAALPTGIVQALSGGFRFDPTAMDRNSISILIPTASLETSSSLLSNVLRSERFLAAERFPEITFQSTAIASKDNVDFDLTGDVTIRGVKRSQRLQASFVDGGSDPLTGKGYARFHAIGHLRRSDFGVTFAPASISDDVLIEMDILGLRIGQ